MEKEAISTPLHLSLRLTHYLAGSNIGAISDDMAAMRASSSYSSLDAAYVLSAIASTNRRISATEKD